MCDTPQMTERRRWASLRQAARLYGASLSYPSLAARAMLEHKGIELEWAELTPGPHPFQLRLAGFRGGTVQH